MCLFVKRFLDEEAAGLCADELLEKYEEAKIMREFDVGVMQEAIVKAFGGKKR